MKVWYHGTTPESVPGILADGFKSGTYFARNLSDALHMGGDVLFEVIFDADPTKDWQYITSAPVNPDRILLCYQTTPTIIHRNSEAEKRLTLSLFRKDHGSGVHLCEHCYGRGQLEDYAPFVRWRDNMPVTLCPACWGYGSPEIRRRQEVAV